MRRKIIFGLVFLTLACFVPDSWSQADYPWLRVGDELYTNRAYTDAETAYRKALEEKEKPTTTFNLGNTIYRQNRIPEAIAQYESTISLSNNPQIKADAWYNLGNAHFENKDFEKSVQAYKESLKLRPDDEDAKKNLVAALRQFRQQQQQQQQQQEQEEKDNQQNKDQQQPSDSDQKESKDQQQSSSQNQSQTEQEQQTKEDLSKEEAKEILKAIDREDQRVQEKLKKGNAKTLPPVKDW
jgi:tetratricopeptide (TPR) repeat protein